MIKSMNDLINEAKKVKKATLVVAMANDKPVLEAVKAAKQDGLVDVVLVGPKTELCEMMNDLGMAHEDYVVIDQSDPVAACLQAVKLVSTKKKHFLMKGLVDTSVILKAVLDKDIGLRTPNRLSHVSVMEVAGYHKFLLMTDGAMNTYPDVDTKQEIIENSLLVTRALGITHPNVACIAAVEKVNPKMPATLDCQALVDRYLNGRIKGCAVGGPFGLDNAISKDAALHKGILDPMAGDIDVLLMPQIEAGNVFYKTMMFLANAKSASVIVGAKKPVVLTSRADTKDTKYQSIALGALMAD